MWGLKKLTKGNHMPLANRRGECEDRRVFGPPNKFPLLDRIGRLIKMDRRSIPDRRIANIKVKEDHLTFDSKRYVSVPYIGVHGVPLLAAVIRMLMTVVRYR